MSKDNDNNHGSEILELEVGGADLLFKEGEGGSAVDPLAETALFVEGDVSSTVIPSRDQEEEIQNLLGALGKTGEESPEDSLQAFSKSGDDEEWKPAVVVEAEKSTTKKQAAGAHQKVEVFSSKKIPGGTPIGLPRGNTPRIRKDLGGVQEILREDGTSKLKAVPPPQGNTLTAPVTELAESAAEKKFFGGNNTPPKGFEAVQKGGENYLGDTWVDEDPSWIDRHSSKLLGCVIIVIVVVVVVLAVSTLDTAKTSYTSTTPVEQQQTITENEELLPPIPPISESSSVEEKWTEEERRNLEAEQALALAEENREKAEDVAEELVSSATKASPTTPSIGFGSARSELPVKEATDYSEVYKNMQGKVDVLSEDVQLFAVDILGMVSQTTGLTVQNPQQILVETEEIDSEESSFELDLDGEVLEIKEKSAMSLTEMLAIDYTKPRNEDDCVAVMDRAGSDELGEFEGMMCCRNLQILSGVDVTDCQIRVENF